MPLSSLTGGHPLSHNTPRTAWGPDALPAVGAVRVCLGFTHCKWHTHNPPYQFLLPSWKWQRGSGKESVLVGESGWRISVTEPHSCPTSHVGPSWLLSSLLLFPSWHTWLPWMTELGKAPALWGAVSQIPGLGMQTKRKAVTGLPGSGWTESMWHTECLLPQWLIYQYIQKCCLKGKPLQPIIVNARVPWEVIPLLFSTSRETCILCKQRNTENCSMVLGEIPIYLSLVRSKAT